VPSDKEQKVLLLCLERLCEVNNAVIPKVVRILNDLYDVQVVEEEIILKWHKNPTPKIKPEIATQVRQAAQKFIDWLTYVAALKDSVVSC